MYIYSGIIVSLFVLGFTRSFFFYWVCSKCSQALHDNMFSNIIRATMHFYNTNPSGECGQQCSLPLGTTEGTLRSDPPFPSLHPSMQPLALTRLGRAVESESQTRKTSGRPACRCIYMSGALCTYTQMHTPHTPLPRQTTLP